LKIPYVRRNLSVPLKDAMKHWESTNDPLDFGEDPAEIKREYEELSTPD
jgi:hypothetical protein